MTRNGATPRSLLHLTQALATAVDARGVLDHALDAIVDLGCREALVAIVLPRGVDVRATAGIDIPPENAIRKIATELRTGQHEARLPSDDAPLTVAVQETGAGGWVLALADVETHARSAFADLHPFVLLALSRAALVLWDWRRTAEVARLHETAQRVAASLDLDQVLPEIVRDAAELLSADNGDMLLLDEERRRLRVVAVANFPSEMVGFEMELGEGVSSRAMAARRAVIVDDYQRYRHRVRRLDRYRFRSVLCAPLIARGEPIGALNLHTTAAGRRFTQDDARLLTAFANQAAIAIDNARRYRNEVRLAEDLARTNRELERSLTLQQRLVQQVLLDRGPGGVAQELASVLGRAVVLQDHLFRVVAGAAPSTDGAGSVDRSDVAPWTDLVLPREAATSRGLARFLQDLREAGRPSELPPQLLDGPRRLVAPIRLARETAGYLTVPSAAMGSLDLTLLEVAATGVALEFAKLRMQVDMEQRLRGDVVGDLVAGAFVSPDSIAARAARMGLDLRAPCDLLVFRIDDFEEVAERLGETRTLDLKRRFADALQASIATQAPGAVLALQNETAIVLTPDHSRGDGAPGRDAQALARELLELVAVHLPEASISAAVGDDCSAPTDYQESFRLAQAALDAMGKLGRRGDAIDARRLGVYRLLISAADPKELRDFAIRTLGPLLDGGQQHRELLDTLRAYVDAGFNQREAARRSFVHFNTVAYRLRKVEELLGLHLNDSQSLLDVTFALRLAVLTDVPPPQRYPSITVTQSH